MTPAKGSARLAIFLSHLGGGGAQRAMVNLAGGMAARGHDVEIVLSRAVGPLVEQVPPPVRIVDLGAPRVLASLPRLAARLRRERYDAMVSALEYVNLVAIWARALSRVSMPLAICEQNNLSAASSRPLRRRQRWIPALARRFYPWADSIVAVSDGVADDLVEVLGVPRDRIRTVHNPIVTPTLRALADAPLDHPWFRPGEPPVALAVGRLSPQKDFPNLLQAFARLRRRRPARLVILGEGAERKRLEALVGELGVRDDVALPGFVANPYAYMRRAGAFVLSSRFEGLPSVLIEALYCGAPLVATDCPSGPREILEGGRWGALVPVGDSEALATAIEAALAGEAPRPPPESWQLYELESVVDRYLALLLGSPRA